MAKHWIYVLRCENEHLYVGETTRLFRRLLEHVRSQGGINTKMFKPICLTALYLVSNNYEKGDVKKEVLPHHDIENLITEMLMMKDPSKWYMVHGGKYTKQNMTVHSIVSSFKNKNKNNNRYSKIQNRPFCHCGMPCEKNINVFHGYIVYKCSLHNVWNGMERFLKKLKTDFDISYEPCEYYYKEINGPNTIDSLGEIESLIEHIKSVNISKHKKDKGKGKENKLLTFMSDEDLVKMR